MTRYFLNLTNAHGPLIDNEGVEADDVPAVERIAIANLRGLLAHEVMQGSIDLRGHIDIVDDQGVSVARMPFTDAVSVKMPDGG